MRKIALVVLLWLTITVPVPSSSLHSSEAADPTPQDTSQSSQAQELLAQSYKLSTEKEVGKLDRVRFLNSLVIVAPDIAPTKTVEWAKQLRTLAVDSELAKDANEEKAIAWDRMAFQKNALVAISKIDATKAMDLFSELGAHPVNTEDEKPEDLRAYGARVIFPNYLKAVGVSSIARLKREAARLTSDGTYPFHAMSLVINELAAEYKGSDSEIVDLFDDALAHYTCPPKTDNQDLEFFTFLQNVRPVVSEARLVNGVNMFADHLTKDGCDTPPKKDHFAALIQTSKGRAQLADSRRALLFKAFEFISDVNAKLGLNLRSRDSELDVVAGVPINQIVSVRYNGSPTPEQLPQVEKMGLQISLTQTIQRVRDSNPQAALQMAESVEEPGSKTVAIASVLSPLAKQDLQQMKELYSRELDDVSALQEGPQKAEATLWMAEAAYQSGDLDNFRYFAVKTFHEGMRTFQQSYALGKNPDRPVDRRPGYKQMTEFVRFASAHGIIWPLDEVQQLTDPKLKMHLLMFAAMGMSNL